MSSSAQQPARYLEPRDEWSHSEKLAARRIYDGALKRELEDTMNAAKERAQRITEPSQLWELEDWLRKRRRDIDDKYDYRYSVLIMLFARLMYEGRITESDLNGLQDDKISQIRRILDISK